MRKPRCWHRGCRMTCGNEMTTLYAKEFDRPRTRRIEKRPYRIESIEPRLRKSAMRCMCKWPACMSTRAICARDYVEKIDDSELRNKVRPFIDASLMMRASDKKDPDLILEISKKGELSHFQRSWALMRVATLLVKTDRERALSAIDDAFAEARRIEESDPDRPRAIIAVANAVLPLDRAKSWEIVDEAVKAANSAEGFTGEDGVMRISLLTKNGSSIRSSSSGEFNVGGIFGELAKEDFEKTVAVTRGFQREAPRASATIAIARTVLEEKKP